MCREGWRRALAEAQRGAVGNDEPDAPSDGGPLVVATVAGAAVAGGA